MWRYCSIGASGVHERVEHFDCCCCRRARLTWDGEKSCTGKGAVRWERWVGRSGVGWFEWLDGSWRTPVAVSCLLDELSPCRVVSHSTTQLWALRERVPSCTAAHVEIPWSCGRCSVRSDAGPPRAPQMSGTTIDPAAAIAQALRGWKQRWPHHSRPVDARAHGIPSGRARANTMQRSGHAGHSVSRSTRSAAAPARRVQQECGRQRSDSTSLFLRYPTRQALAGMCICACSRGRMCVRVSEVITL